ncbi:Heterogeneous nuclear ribonucleoprotein 1 [Dendrobium catenatum]|uniref:Heterogeneous nuclear ribonucleoprotein 1 n=1 Tax=Dendrobium catenatum TaxID=906689 RepID=A0A2I0VU44_9ASPA|nr:Heterogeneous nuclear ribonucleoprotein 1 [Dendrobium catenatum]
MGKKRKVEGTPSPAGSGASEENVSVHEESSFNQESATPFPIEPSTEGSWAPEIAEPINEVSLIEEDPKPQAVETEDPILNTSGVGEVSYADGEEDVEDNDPAFLQKLLEPFSKDQVVDILRDAALKHPDIWASIRQIADADPAHRKVFVHGLGWNATAETLVDAFRQFGEIEDCKAIVDKITGRSKGYGFILFKHRSGARRALKEPQKKIGNKMTACQLASEGPPPASLQATAFVYNPPSFVPSSEYTQRKIYVSNVGADLDPNKVLQFFSKFGEIEEGPLGLDKATGKPRGFCLFVYKNAESAKNALEEPHKNFEGNILHCQRAIDGPKLNKQGAYLLQGAGQYAGMQQGKSGFGAHGAQIGRIETSVSMGGMPSSVTGPGHLIAPPAVSIRFNQAGQANATAATGYNPGLGKYLSAFRATQGAGFGPSDMLRSHCYTGLTVKNAGLAVNPAFGNQIRGAGGYVKPGVVGGYGASLRIHGSYGNSAMGQGGAWNPQGFSNTGGLGSSTGQ